MSGKHDTLVPGVNDMGNRRPRVKAKVKGGKTKEVKAAVPVTQPVVVETMDHSGQMTSLSNSGFVSTDISTLGTDIASLHSKGVTLKDLCAEDKKRIANLIKELARVGEEKDSAEHNLTEERQHYQHQILTLVQQQEAILKEREEVQNRLLEYQNYIVKLQQQQQLQQLLQHQKRNRQRHQQQQPQQSQAQKQPRAKDALNEAMKTSSSHSKENEINPKRMEVSRREKQGSRGGTDSNDYIPLSGKEGDPVCRQEVVRKSEGTASRKEILDQGRNHQEGNLGRDSDFAAEEPSTHLYINQSNSVSTPDQSEALDGLSTHVLPPQSPPSHQSSSRPLPHRPFTAMIDKQLTKERKRVKEVETGRLNEAELDFEEAALDEKATGGPVSPEKAELFSRFMGAQSGVRCNDVDDNNDNALNLEPGARNPMQMEEHTQNMAAARQNGKSDQQQNHHHCHKESTKHRRQRSKFPPPSSAGFGVFLPPVMSSTQKSSEIGDFVSNIGDTTMASSYVEEGGNGNERLEHDGKAGVRGHRRGEGRIEVREMDSKRVGKMERGRKEEKEIFDEMECDNNNNGGGRHATQKELKASDERDVEITGVQERELLQGADKEFINYYKKLSASERKEELLKQRAALMEEQNKLRLLLTRHGTHNDKKKNLDARQQDEAKIETREIERGGVRGVKSMGGQRMEDVGLDPSEEEVVSGHGVRRGISLAENVKDGNSHSNQNGTGEDKRIDVRGAKKTKGECRGRKLRGTDGDECETYCEENAGDAVGDVGVDTIVKTLNYSMGSNEGEESPIAPSALNRKFVVSPSGGHDDNQTKMVTPAKMDAATCMSFRDLPIRGQSDNSKKEVNKPGLPNLPEGNMEQKQTSSRHKKTTGTLRAPSSFSLSPGDKTLDVLKIINTLPDNNNDDDDDDDDDHHLLVESSSTNYKARSQSQLTLKGSTQRRRENDGSGVRNIGGGGGKNRRLGFGVSHGGGGRDKTLSHVGGGGGDGDRIVRRGNGGVVSTKNVRDKVDDGKYLVRGGMGLGGDGGRSGWKTMGRFGSRGVDCNRLKEERMRGLRNIADGYSYEEDEEEEEGNNDDDDTFYDYDNGDDSNIDDIVEDLVLDDEGVDKWREGGGKQGTYLNRYEVDDDNDEEEVSCDSVIKTLNRVDVRGGQGKMVVRTEQGWRDIVTDDTDDDGDVEAFDWSSNSDSDVDAVRTRVVTHRRPKLNEGESIAREAEVEEDILEDVFFAIH